MNHSIDRRTFVTLCVATTTAGTALASCATPHTGNGPNPSKTPEACKDHIDHLVAAGVPACLGLTAWRDGKLFAEYWAGHEIPGDAASKLLTPDMRLNVGSVTKPVTGALLFLLAEKGKLTLEDKVVRYVPEFPYDDVTLLHLMTHTSGYHSDQNVGWPGTFEQLPGYFNKIYSTKPRRCAPGEQCFYWSSGYSVLMDVIQRVAGEDLESFSQRELFQPLEMHHTNYDVRKVPADQIILPWSGAEPMKVFLTTPPIGDSGLLTTARDLVRFGHAVMTGKSKEGHRIFKEESVKRMLAECTDGRFDRTPLFFYRGKENKAKCFGALNSEQAVGHPAFSACMLMLDPPKRVVAAMTANTPKFHEDWTNYGKLWDVVLAG